MTAPATLGHVFGDASAVADHGLFSRNSVFDVAAGIFDCVIDVLAGITKLFDGTSVEGVLDAIGPVEIGLLLTGRKHEQRRGDEQVTIELHIDRRPKERWDEAWRSVAASR